MRGFTVFVIPPFDHTEVDDYDYNCENNNNDNDGIGPYAIF